MNGLRLVPDSQTGLKGRPRPPKMRGLWHVPDSPGKLAASSAKQGSPRAAGALACLQGCSPSRPLHPLWEHCRIMFVIKIMIMNRQPTSYGRSTGKHPKAPALHCRRL